MFGLANELCGENGFGWARRLMLLHESLKDPKLPEAGRNFSTFLGAKYGYDPIQAEAAPDRIADILTNMAHQLEMQRKRGSRFLIGDQLSALDIYWACFAALLRPLPQDLCAMAQGFRKMYTCGHPTIMAATTPDLFDHRDHIYREYLELPVDL